MTRGTIIFRQGDPGDDMFVLERGRVSLTLTTGGTDELASSGDNQFHNPWLRRDKGLAPLFAEHPGLIGRFELRANVRDVLLHIGDCLFSAL